MNILAIDPGTLAGWAHSCGISGVWDLTVKKDESGGMRLIRFRSKLNEIRKEAGIDVVVFEAVRNAAPGMQRALVVGGEIQGVLKLWCEIHGIDYRGYSPTEIKKWATGKGNANKDKMMEAAGVKWPDVKIEDNNQADALWLLDLAMSEYSAD
jgi:Holliday junction resolvasome RuvABC endonuclease subunit